MTCIVVTTAARLPSHRGDSENLKLIVYARVPELGKVKTRLAAQMGDVAALAAYRSMLLNVLDRMSRLDDIDKELCVTGADTAGECSRLASEFGFSLAVQGQGDLGQRMHATFRQALSSHSRVLLVGSDCPLLDESRIRWALTALEQHDAVFVPVEDGGYSLVGLRRLIPELFAGIAWSTDSVMQESRSKLRDLGASWLESEVLWDVDEPEDWERWRRL